MDFSRNITSNFEIHGELAFIDDKFLTIADKHGIGSMVILFCDCAFAGREPYLGKQDEPVPGVHNSGWVPSPGLKRVTDKSVWPDLERYVKDIVGSFGKDDPNLPFPFALSIRLLPKFQCLLRSVQSMGHIWILHDVWL